MGFLDKLFGAKPDIEKLRRALERKEFVEALHIAEDLKQAGIEAPDLESLAASAADGLARLNLDEGERLLAAGDELRAQEHLQLALEQVVSSELKAAIELCLERPNKAPVAVSPQPASEAPPSAGCGGCAPAAQEVEELGSLPDSQARLELILASYPPDLRDRYLACSEDFKKAFLLGHEGVDSQALDSWTSLPETEHCGLYYFELGSLYGRMGDAAKAHQMLGKAMSKEPGNILVIDALLSLTEDIDAAKSLLLDQLEKGAEPSFCQARMSQLCAMQQDHPAALEWARKALSVGFVETEFLIFAAQLYEINGEADTAEQLLCGLPGGGCGGGINLHLAEFWLRQERELGRVLDAFNGACRQEPENPRWQLRVAQTYIARNWKKQGLELLQRVVGDPRLEDALRVEAQQLLAES